MPGRQRHERRAGDEARLLDEATLEPERESWRRTVHGVRAQVGETLPSAPSSGAHVRSASSLGSTARRRAPSARCNVTARTGLEQPMASAASSADRPARYRRVRARW